MLMLLMVTFPLASGADTFHGRTFVIDVHAVLVPNVAVLTFAGGETGSVVPVAGSDNVKTALVQGTGIIAGDAVVGPERSTLSPVDTQAEPFQIS